MDRHIGMHRVQLVVETLSHRLDGRLARVVSRVARRIGDALLGPRDDDGRRGGTLIERLDRRQEGRDPVDHAVQVHVEDGAERGRVRPARRRARDACVEGEEVYLA